MIVNNPLGKAALKEIKKPAVLKKQTSGLKLNSVAA